MTDEPDFERLGQECGRALAVMGVTAVSACGDDAEAMKQAVQEWHAEMKQRIAGFMAEMRATGTTEQQIRAWADACLEGYLTTAGEVNEAAFGALPPEGSA